MGLNEETISKISKLAAKLGGNFSISRHLFADVISVHNRIMQQARAGTLVSRLSLFSKAGY